MKPARGPWGPVVRPGFTPVQVGRNLGRDGAPDWVLESLRECKRECGLKGRRALGRMIGAARRRLLRQSTPAPLRDIAGMMRRHQERQQ